MSYDEDEISDDQYAFERYKGKLVLIVGDTLYEVTQWLRNGAADMLAGVPYWCNPHRADSQRAMDWDNGHELAAANRRLADMLGGSPVEQLASLVVNE